VVTKTTIVVAMTDGTWSQKPLFGSTRDFLRERVAAVIEGLGRDMVSVLNGPRDRGHGASAGIACVRGGVFRRCEVTRPSPSTAGCERMV
jgi:hypothetical protein